ncbi:MAG TPA: T9SS type A sorting domain-containing protein [Ignavibacteriaceae bacterium]|nr:T9SS type A sorting domain-containing protein [Ignavibacteriaceae bacterium]
MFLFFHSAVNAQQYYNWSVGNTGKILKTTNGGTNLTTQSSGTTNDLYSVYFVNETTGWAVGWSGKILRSINGGTNWSSQSSGTSLDFRSVFVIPDSVTDVSEEPLINLSNTILLKNHPNPFNPSTTITYSIPDFGLGSLPVKLIVYNLLGEKITTLVDEEKSSGFHSVEFNASNIPSGVYIYNLTTNGHSVSKKMLYLR